MKLRRSALVGCAILLLASLGWTAIRWVRGAAPHYGGDLKAAVDCGNIKGFGGCVRGWDLVDTGKEWIVTDADLGGEWANPFAQSQYQMRTAVTVQPQDEHYHRYSYVSVGSGTVYATIRAHAIQVINLDGQCSQLDPTDPQWWWVPNVVYTDRGISIEVYDAEASEWDSLSWENTHENSPCTYASQNSGQGPHPQGSGSNGEIRVATSLPVLPQDSHIRVSFKWKVTAGATVDNATVQQWQEVVTYTAYSQLTTAAPDVDFDLDEERCNRETVAKVVASKATVSDAAFLDIA